MSKLLELAERVEKLTGSDREIFREVWLACCPRSSFATGRASDGARNKFMRLVDEGALLDAARTLVPPPGKWSITAGQSGDWQACVWLKDGLALDWRSSVTPALALTAAALRVRAQGEAA
jgi:hypothetical protein